MGFSRGFATGTLLLALAACAPRGPAAEPQRPQVEELRVDVVAPVASLRPGAEAVAELRARGIVLASAEVPPARPAPTGDSSEAVAAARAAYIDDGDFARCLQLLEDVDPTALLARGDRLAAARALVWRGACALGMRRRDAARLEARRLATFGLPVPPDLGQTNPEFEALAARAISAAGRARRLPVKIRAAEGARVSVDGAPACIAPCTASLIPGEHVIAVERDGLAPAWRTVRVTRADEVDIAQQPADPERAAAQWHQRRARGEAVDDAGGLALLGLAVRARNLVWLAPAGGRVRGALLVDGRLRARSERPAGDGATEALIRELLIQGRLLDPGPPLWKRWSFWGVVTATAVAAGGAAAWLVAAPDRRTEVGF